MKLVEIHTWVTKILAEAEMSDALVVDELDFVVHDAVDGTDYYNALERSAVRHEAYRTAALLVKERDGVHD